MAARKTDPLHHRTGGKLASQSLDEQISVILMSAYVPHAVCTVKLCWSGEPDESYVVLEGVGPGVVLVEDDLLNVKVLLPGADTGGPGSADAGAVRIRVDIVLTQTDLNSTEMAQMTRIRLESEREVE